MYIMNDNTIAYRYVTNQVENQFFIICLYIKEVNEAKKLSIMNITTI